MGFPAEPAPGRPPRRRRRRRRMVLGGSVAVVAAAGVAIAVISPFRGPRTPGTGVTDNGAATALATVTRQNLSSQMNVNATLGYAGSYTALNQAQGIITALPDVGRVVRDGQVLYWVNGAPVVLLYGPTPAYRSLAEGTLASDVTGPDVQQLNRDLVAMGYVSSSLLDPSSDEFGWATKYGVEQLQAHLGVKQTGKLALGQVVFLPSAARITAVSATLGGQAQPGQPVLTATSTARRVIIALDAAQQSEVKAGDKVTITLPDNQTTPGVVSSVGKVATSSSSGATVTLVVTPLDPAVTGSLDQAPVQVTITTGSVSDALVVPVRALLALAGGGYAVEVVGAGGIHHLVPVSPGLFDDADGLVQVTGAGISAGQRVVVPAT